MSLLSTGAIYSENQVIERNLDDLPAGNILLVDALPDDALRVFSQARPDITWFVYTPFIDTYEVLSKQGEGLAQVANVNTSAWLSQEDIGDVKFVAAIIYFPKAKQRFDYYVSMVSKLLSPDGLWFAVGEKKGGVKGCEKALKPFAAGVKKVDAARHCMLFSATFNNQACHKTMADWFTTKNVDVQYKPSKAERSAGPLSTVELTLASLPGVFSATRLDSGTEMLLKEVHDLKGHGLDFGCGCGVIATTIAKTQEVTVDALDVDALAVASTMRTFELNSVDGKAIHSNGISGLVAKPTYKFIVSNPPFHTGLKTDYSIVEKFIKDSKVRLKMNYQMWVVANSFLPYQDWFAKFLRPATTVVNNKRFSVYVIK